MGGSRDQCRHVRNRDWRGPRGGSASLQADALDFLGDAANYAISLFVVGMALRYRVAAALAKSASMGAFGLWVIGVAVWHAWQGTLPQAFTMGAFGLLWAYRGATPTCAPRGSAP